MEFSPSHQYFIESKGLLKLLTALFFYLGQYQAFLSKAAFLSNKFLTINWEFLKGMSRILAFSISLQDLFGSFAWKQIVTSQTTLQKKYTL